MSKLKRLNFDLPEELDTEIRDLTKNLRRPLTWVLRDALELYIKANKLPEAGRNHAKVDLGLTDNYS